MLFKGLMVAPSVEGQDEECDWCYEVRPVLRVLTIELPGGQIALCKECIAEAWRERDSE